MMRNPSKRRAMLKYLLVIPLTLLVLLVFSNAEAKASLQQQAEEVQQAVAEQFDTKADLNVVTKVWGENFTKIAIEDGEIRLEAKDGVTVRVDTVPISLESKSSNEEMVNFEIYYANGEVEKLTRKVNDNEILKKINPSDIESIEVFRNDGQNLIKIWLKGSKKPNTDVIDLDEAPIFAGCEGEQNPQKRLECSQRRMLEYVYKAIKYPKEAREKGIQGTVYVKYTIDEQGFVKDAKVQQGIGGGCDEEVLRVVKSMPQWKPAIKNGKSVASVYHMLPVHYKLEGQEGESAAIEEMIFRDTVVTFNPDTYEEKVKIVENPAEKVVVVGYGVTQKNKSMPSETEEIFKVVEEMPRFPGCEDLTGDEKVKKDCADRRMLEFIFQNIKYPQAAREKGIEGICVVSFIVGKDGVILEPKVVRSIGSGCDEEVIRLVNLMPKWIPGKQKGQSVDVQFNLPIRFKLSEEDKQQAVAQANVKLPANTLKLQNFKASPNPTTGILNLSFSGERKPTVVKVFDLQGKELQSLNVQHFDGSFHEQLDLSKAPKGTLIISVIQGEKVYSDKIILQ